MKYADVRGVLVQLTKINIKGTLIIIARHM